MCVLICVGLFSECRERCLKSPPEPSDGVKYDEKIISKYVLENTLRN